MKVFKYSCGAGNSIQGQREEKWSLRLFAQFVVCKWINLQRAPQTLRVRSLSQENEQNLSLSLLHVSLLNSIITFTFSSSFVPSPPSLMSQGFCYVCSVQQFSIFVLCLEVKKEEKLFFYFLCRYQQQLATTGESYEIF